MTIIHLLRNTNSMIEPKICFDLLVFWPHVSKDCCHGSEVNIVEKNVILRETVPFSDCRFAA